MVAKKFPRRLLIHLDDELMRKLEKKSEKSKSSKNQVVRTLVLEHC